MQDYILAGNPRAQLALENELDRARHLKPRLAGRHARREVGRTNAGRECAQCAVGAGVAVRADDELTGSGQTFFREQRMLDAHCADVEEVDDIVLLGELAALEALLGGLDVLIRCKMVHYERDLGVVEHLVEARLLHLSDGNRTGDIVCQREIYVCLDQLTCRYAFQTRVLREDLLRHCHTHNSVPPAELVVKILVDAVDVRLDGCFHNVNRYAAAGDELVAASYADLDDRFALCVLAVGQCE